MNGALLKVSGLEAGYGRRQVLRGLDISIDQGQFTALLGLNGSGKTTLLRSICGLHKPWSGQCLVWDERSGRHIDCLGLGEYQRARLLSYIPQRHSTVYNTSVLDVVLMGFNPHLRLLESPGKNERRLAREALAYLHLEGREEDDFLSLSEGQKQLVILARCLVQDTPVMMMDEPDSALDFVNRDLVLGQIRQLIHDKQRGGMITLHDPNFAMAYCDRLLLLKDGLIAAELDMRQAGKESLKASLSLIYGDIEVLEHHGRYAMVKA